MKHVSKPGALFPTAARQDFMTITRQRYNAMCVRLKRKKLPLPQFGMGEFRKHFALALGAEDSLTFGAVLPRDGGAIKCRYCNHYFSAQDVAADHAMPLSRGGSNALSNIEFPCARCNSRKGSLTPDEFLALLDFLEKRIPYGRLDVLDRLEKAVQLMAGAAEQRGVIGELKKSGAWQDAQKMRREAKKQKEKAF
jgi:hypothetical protein